jgi:hypothetical protein
MSDQWFSESRFKSYRALGFVMLGAAHAPAPEASGSLRQMLEALC